ncbi:MAG: hypothetical protein E5X63_41095, partial [Mesorhizobium sp.]
FSPCGRRWPRKARSDKGCSSWHHLHSVQHPSSVSALRADPPSPTTRGEGRKGSLTPEAPRSPVFLPWRDPRPAPSPAWRPWPENAVR